MTEKKANSFDDNIFGLAKSPLTQIKIISGQTFYPKNSKKEVCSNYYILGANTNIADFLKKISPKLTSWQKLKVQKQLKKPKALSALKKLDLVATDGVIQLYKLDKEIQDNRTKSTAASLEPSTYGGARNCVSNFKNFEFSSDAITNIVFYECSAEEKRGFIVGLELAAYKFKTVFYNTDLPKRTKSKNNSSFINKKLNVYNLDKKELKYAHDLAHATNLARHLVNLPPNILTPKTYSAICQGLFKTSKSSKVTIWDDKKLQKEGMELIYSVGKSSEFGSCLVHIRYRSKAAKNNAPYVFVGKGITFDTGGLDLKPPSGMLLMKKDMGGSASVLGLANYVEQAQLALNCDFYLAIAENSVSANSFRPSDILTARNGKTVEIGNTDAEGRLVLADALCIATEQEQKAQLIVDLATLTGAMRIALGADIAGILSNEELYSKRLLAAATKRNEPCWQLPLFSKYRAGLNSNCADINNISSIRGGGAISAAHFLQEFVDNTPWIHVDMMAWTNGNDGALRERGGNGQLVQSLALFLENEQ